MMAWCITTKSLLLAAVVAAASCMSPVMRHCPPGFKDWGSGNCHYHVQDQFLTHAQAKQKCAGMGATLPYLTPANIDYSLVLSQVTRTSFWIGMTDIAQEGRWVWDNGQPVTKFNWVPGDPNGGNKANCGLFHGLHTEWFDVICDRAQDWICVKMMPSMQPRTSVFECPDDWAPVPSAGKCMKNFFEPRDFDLAKRTCKTLGATLPSAKDTATMTSLKQQIPMEEWIDSGSSSCTILAYGSPQNKLCPLSFPFKCVIDLKDKPAPPPIQPPQPPRPPRPQPSTEDNNPDVCKSNKKAGILEDFCNTKKGKASCAESCKEFEDEDPKMCEKQEKDGKLDAFCKTSNRNKCKKSCRNTEDEDTRVCKKQSEAGTLDAFCKTSGRKKCRKTCRDNEDEEPKFCQQLKNEGKLAAFCKTSDRRRCRRSCRKQDDKPIVQPLVDDNPTMCETVKKAGNLHKICKTRDGKKQCKKSCHDLENGGLVDADPAKCKKMKDSGKLTKFFCRTEGKKLCKKSCQDVEIVDKDPGRCKKMMDQNKLTKRYCKKDGKKFCKLSCQNPQEQTGDTNPKLCKSKAKDGKLAKFCKTRTGQKECKATCA